MKKTINHLLVLALLCCIPFFAGCSDDDDDDPVAASLHGVAASGLAMADTQVTLMDAAGTTRTSTTAADGSFTFDITGLAAPFALRAGELYSAATTGGTANVNPLTTIAFVASAGVDTPADGFEAARIALIRQAALDTAASAINTLLAPATSALGCNGTDFLRGSCPANHTGFDALFDAITITISGGDITIKAGATTLVSGSLDGLGELDPMDAAAVDDVTSRLDWVSTYHFVSLDLDIEGNGAESYTGTLELKADSTFIVKISGTTDQTGTFTLDDDGILHLSTGEALAFNTGCQLFTEVDTDADKEGDLGFTLGTRTSASNSSDILKQYTYLAVPLLRDQSGNCESGIAMVDFEDATWTLIPCKTGNPENGGYSLDTHGNITGDIEGWIADQGRIIILPDNDEDPDVGFTLLFALQTGAQHDGDHLKDQLSGTYHYAEMSGDSQTYMGTAACDGTNLTLTCTAASDGQTGSEELDYTAPITVPLCDTDLAADSFVLGEGTETIIGFPVYSENLVVFPETATSGLSLLFDTMSWNSL